MNTWEFPTSISKNGNLIDEKSIPFISSAQPLRTTQFFSGLIGVSLDTASFWASVAVHPIKKTPHNRIDMSVTMDQATPRRQRMSEGVWQDTQQVVAHKTFSHRLRDDSNHLAACDQVCGRQE